MSMKKAVNSGHFFVARGAERRAKHLSQSQWPTTKQRESHGNLNRTFLFAQGLAHHRLLSYAPWAYFHGNLYGLAFPNCYVRPSIAYLFRCRKDGMQVIFLSMGLYSRTATLLVYTALCYFTCRKQHRTLPNF